MAPGMDASTAATLLSVSGSSNISTNANLSLAKGKSMSMDQIDKTSQDFESMFVGQMLDQMFGETEGDDMFGDSDTSDVYRGMMVDQFGKEIAQAGGIGIAAYVKQELLKLQEV